MFQELFQTAKLEERNSIQSLGQWSEDKDVYWFSVLFTLFQ